MDSSPVRGLEGLPVEVVQTSSGADARSLVQDPSKKLAALFLNPAHPAVSGIKMVSLVHELRPATPIYALYSESPPFSEQETRSLAIAGVVRKPLTRETITELVPRIGSAPERVTSAEDAGEYRPVPVSDFLSGAVSVFDVYAKLDSGEFRKVLEAKNAFGAEQLDGYLRSGVTQLYIAKNAHRRCLDYCDLIGKSLFHRGSVSFEVKFSETLNRGAEIWEEILRSGVDERQIERATGFLCDASLLIEKLDREPGGIELLLSHVDAHDHAIGTALMALLLAASLGGPGEKQNPGAIGLAAFLHDVGFHQLPPQLRDEGQPTGSARDLALLRQHPLIGAQLLSKLPDVDPELVQAVARHHERRDGSGYPLASRLPEPDRMAEMIGICDEFVRARRAHPDRPLAWQMERLAERSFSGFSPEVVEGFRKIFPLAL